MKQSQLQDKKDQ
jgi:hypothetical protein